MQQLFNCPNCGAQIVYGVSNCYNCGTPFSWDQVSPPAPPADNYYQDPNQQQWGQNPPYNQQQGGWGQQQQGNQPGQQYNQQQAWGQQQGWNQPPPYNQPPGWGNPPQQRRQPPPGYRGARPGGKTKSLGSMGIVIIVLLVLIAGIGIAIATNGKFFEKSGGSNLPVISSFTSDPSAITAGKSATLQWNVTGATAVSIDQGIGPVTSSGTRDVAPTATTTYILKATNGDGSVTKSAVVTIAAATLPVITGFTANPSTITPGQSATLQWTVTGATSVSIDQGVGPVTATSQSVSPTTSTTYTLTATNSGGSVTSTAVVSVNASSVPVITSFTATPGNIGAGQSSTLQWVVTGAVTISISPNVGAVVASGTATVTPTTTTTYTLTATNSNGQQATASAVVTFGAVAGAPVINSFTVTPESLTAAGQPATLAWNVSNATAVSIAPFGGMTAVSTGQLVINPSATSTYTLTATNSAGSVTATATVTIAPAAGSPVIASFIANPSTITSGASSNLSWSVTGTTTSISISPNVGNVAATGTTNVSPTSTTTYTLTATNTAGSVTSTQTVIVNAPTATPPVINSFIATPPDYYYWY